MPDRSHMYTAIISAVIGATGLIIAHNLDVIKIEKPKPVAFGTYQSHLDSQPLEVGKTYRAKTDGFVAVYTHDEGVNRKVYVDVSRNSKDLSIITRAGVFEGTVCPVPEGHYWRVRDTKGSGKPMPKGRVTIHWLAVNTIK